MKFDLGHMKSQKFSALVFAVFVLFVAGFTMPPEVFGTLALAVTGLYGAFVGGRAWSDGQAMKWQRKSVPTRPPKDEDEDEKEVD